MSFGQMAYEAYFRASEGKSLISGAPLPTWEQQDPRIQSAWETAAGAVVASLIADDDDGVHAG